MAALLALTMLLPVLSRGLAAEVQHFVAEGATIELSCPIAPRERWDRVTWERPIGRFLAVGRYYRIDVAAAADSGTYICRKLRFRPAANGPRSATSRVHLVVQQSESGCVGESLGQGIRNQRMH